MLPLRIFISSPGDVGSERAVAVAVCERLQLEFRGIVHLETYLWERSLLRATDTFQAQILDVQEADLAIFILWARTGTALPERFHRSDGSRYASGTEYEFEHAMTGYEVSGRPDILFYLKTAEVRISVKAREHRRQQTSELDAVNQFVDKWLRNADGSFKSAFYDFETAARFEELLEIHVREWIRERLKRVAPISTPRMWEGSPFRGLQPFDFEHSLIYCGRTGLIAEVIDLLRLRAESGRGFLMIIGMSGAGKSSLVRAGILPMLARPRVIERVVAWRRAVFRPSESQSSLWAGMAAALTEQQALPELAEEGAPVETLLRKPETLTLALQRALQRATQKAHEQIVGSDPESRVRLVLVIDQFEEIFEETITPEERAGVVVALATMVRSRQVWAMVTMRADFYARCAELPEAFRDLIERDGLYTVGWPRPAEISQMIRRPAAMAALSFERRGDPEEGLDDLLRDTAAEQPTVLPLLEFTLDELWKRSAGSGLLRFSDYEALGGLHGALRQRANEEFGRLPASARAALHPLLASLVRADPKDDRLIVESRVPRAQLAGVPGCETLINAFVHAHLLVTDRAPDGTPVIGLAHEALLREWPPAAEWIEQNRELLRLRASIAAAAALWRDSRKSSDRLLLGSLLNDASKLLTVNPTALAPEERSFVEASRSEARRRQRRRALLGATAGVVVAAVVMISMNGLSPLLHALSVVQTVPTVWTSDQRVPLSPLTRANLAQSADWLIATLRPQLEDMRPRPELTPWAVAQMWAALHGLDPSLSDSSARLREFMTAQRSADCQCWRETEDKLPHTLATAWVFYALALYDQPATAQEIVSVLDRQRGDGWWSMYPSTPDPKNASTSATTWTIVALHQQLRKNLVAPEHKARVAGAIRKGTDWLRSKVLPGRARWNEYPPESIAEKKEEFLAVSALVLYALRTTADVREFDASWLAELPQLVPSATENETARGEVFRSATQLTLDEVRHYRFPWMLRATVDAFGAGTVWQKARATVWVENAFKRALSDDDFHREKWTMAEALFGIRHAILCVSDDIKPSDSC